MCRKKNQSFFLQSKTKFWRLQIYDAVQEIKDFLQRQNSRNFVRLHNLIDLSLLGIDDYQRLWIAKTFLQTLKSHKNHLLAFLDLSKYFILIILKATTHNKTAILTTGSNGADNKKRSSITPTTQWTTQFSQSEK